jgi:two-component system, sensor histidine kinase PdtaS
MKRYFETIKTSPSQQALAIALIAIVVNAILYLPPVYRLVGADTVLLVNNLTSIAAAIISVWLAYRLWRSFQPGESQRLIWGSLVAGLFLWMIAEIIWDSYQLLLGIILPSASLADLAWVLGYIALITGLILRLRSFRMRLTKPWQFAILAAFGVLVVLVVFYMIFPVLNDTPTGLSYEKFSGLFYPVFDLVLACLALLLVLVLEGGLLSKPWTAIALACLFIAVSDLLYAFALTRGIYQVNPAAGLDLLSYLIDTSYTFAYVLMALGIYLQARLLDAI